MKKETAFSIVMLVFGIITGFALILILMAIAAPSTSQYLLTIAEKADWERINEYSRYLVGPGSALVYGTFLVALILVIPLFLFTLNPLGKNVLKNWKSAAGVKYIVAFFAVLGWMYILAIGSDSLFAMESGTSKTVQFIVFAISTAGLWFIAGEQGWAGDFSSWRPSKDARPTRSMILGATAGTAIFFAYQLFEWAFRKYFILVSEVLDRSGETSFLGFKLLALGSVIYYGLAFPLIAEFVKALAPVQRDNSEVRRRLVYPVVAIAAICAFLAIAYRYAGEKYDLDKTNFASVLGISDKAKESRTVIVFLPSKELPVTIQEWPLQVTGWGLALQTTIEVSRENLQKVESYLKAHPAGSVFTYSARDILVKGYYALWDLEHGLAWQVKAAESQLLPRLQLLGRFRSMRITEENLKLLESYSDENNWHPGGRSALNFSMAYQHFGKHAEAEKWLQKAKEQNADVSNTSFMKEPVVTKGTIRGKVFLNGKPLKGIEVALLGHPTDKQQIESFKLMDLTLSRELQVVGKTDKDGRFTFSALGSGKYLIAIMIDKNVIPFDVKPGALTVNNVPGLIMIGSIAERDLGTITIMRN